MMNDSELKDWVLEKGGPAIRLSIYMSQPENRQNKEVDSIVEKLLNMEKVNSLLNYLDAFKVKSKGKKTLEHLIHYYKDTCIDNFFPRIVSLGFRAGIPAFDEKMNAVRELFSYLLIKDDDYCYNYGFMLHRFFLIAGYSHEELIQSVKQRMNALHKAAKERIFDVYQDGRGLPKVPKLWENRGILKTELNPFDRTAEKPLPTIYDLSALAYFPDSYKDSIVQTQIDDIVEYILDPQFQQIPEGYGLLWNKTRRIYNACGWSPTLPLYEDYCRPQHLGSYSVLNYLNMISNFKTAQKTEWFINCLNHVEQFKTEKGTYIFPSEYLNGQYISPRSTSNLMGIDTGYDEAFLNESFMKLKRNKREIIIRELISTMNMIEIKRNIS